MTVYITGVTFTSGSSPSPWPTCGRSTTPARPCVVTSSQSKPSVTYIGGHSAKVVRWGDVSGVDNTSIVRSREITTHDSWVEKLMVKYFNTNALGIEVAASFHNLLLTQICDLYTITIWQHIQNNLRSQVGVVPLHCSPPWLAAPQVITVSPRDSPKPLLQPYLAVVRNSNGSLVSGAYVMNPLSGAIKLVQVIAVEMYEIIVFSSWLAISIREYL